MNITVDENVLFCAFRYALGRRSYVVDEIAYEIEQHAHELTPKVADLICKEINEAIARNQAGMDMDIKRWRRVVDNLQRVLYERKHSNEKTA